METCYECKDRSGTLGANKDKKKNVLVKKNILVKFKTSFLPSETINLKIKILKHYFTKNLNFESS